MISQSTQTLQETRRSMQRLAIVLHQATVALENEDREQLRTLKAQDRDLRGQLMSLVSDMSKIRPETDGELEVLRSIQELSTEIQTIEQRLDVACGWTQPDPTPVAQGHANPHHVHEVRPEYEYVDLLTLLPDALIKTENPSYVNEGLIEQDGKRYKSLFCHLGSTVQFYLRIKSSAVLTFGIHIPEEAWSQSGPGALFHVVALWEGKEELLFHRYLHPQHQERDRGLHWVRIELPQLEGRQVRLRFSTQSLTGSNAYGSAFFVRPFVRQDPLAEITPTQFELNCEESKKLRKIPGPRKCGTCKSPLDAVCYAPFVHCVLTTEGYMRPCCLNYNNELGRFGEGKGFWDLWRGAAMEQFRDAMKNNDLSMGCEKCAYYLEVGDYDTDFPRAYDHLNPNDYMAGPQKMELWLSNKCNYKCVMCHGLTSSRIRSDWDKLPPLPDIYSDPKFWEDMKDVIPGLKEILFAGGEPLMIDHVFRFWDMMVEQKAEALVIVTTNGSIYKDSLEEYFQKLNFGCVNMSFLAATKKTLEEIQIGAKFENVIENLDKFVAAGRKYSFDVAFSVACMNQNAMELPDIYLLAQDHGVRYIMTSHCWAPPECSPFHLPISERKEMVDYLKSRTGELDRCTDLLRSSYVRYVQLLENSLLAPEAVAPQTDSNNEPLACANEPPARNDDLPDFDVL